MDTSPDVRESALSCAVIGNLPYAGSTAESFHYTSGIAGVSSIVEKPHFSTHPAARRRGERLASSPTPPSASGRSPYLLGLHSCWAARLSSLSAVAGISAFVATRRRTARIASNSRAWWTRLSRHVGALSLIR